MELNKEQIEFLNKYTEGKWTINEKTGLVDIEGDFVCSYEKYEKLTDFKGVKFGVVTGSFYCHGNSLTSLEGAPKKVGRHFWCDNNSISEKTLKLVWETIQKNKIDYWTALCILKSEIQKSDFEKLEGELDKRLSQDAQKGYSTLVQFGFFK